MMFQPSHLSGPALGAINADAVSAVADLLAVGTQTGVVVGGAVAQARERKAAARRRKRRKKKRARAPAPAPEVYAPPPPAPALPAWVLPVGGLSILAAIGYVVWRKKQQER